MADSRLSVTEECVEPELISPGGGSYKPRGEEPRRQLPPEKPGFFTRLKMLLAAGLALIGIALFAVGAILTSTVIGAIIGVPLMLLGGLFFFLLFKLLASGSPSPIIFRRF